MGQVGVLVQVAVTPGKFDNLHKCFQEFYQSLGQEAGLEYRQLMLDQDDHSKIFVFEMWESQKDFENHLATPQSKKFAEDIKGSYEPGGFVKTLTPIT